MANVIERPFSIFRDFRSVMWGATFQYNLARSACAGIVAGIIMFCASFSSTSTMAKQNGGPPALFFLFLPMFWPIVYFLIYFPVSLVLVKIGESVPLIGLVSVFFALIFVSIGDPIVCILHKFVPLLVPVQRPALFSLAPIYWVMKPEETQEFVISR